MHTMKRWYSVIDLYGVHNFKHVYLEKPFAHVNPFLSDYITYIDREFYKHGGEFEKLVGDIEFVRFTFDSRA